MAIETDNGGCLTPLWLLFLVFGGVFFFGVNVRQTAPVIERVEPETNVARAAPPLEIVLEPLDAGVSWETLQAAQSIIDQRLMQLSFNGQISGIYNTFSERLSGTITVQLTDSALPEEDLITALTSRGEVAFVSSFDRDAPSSALEGQPLPPDGGFETVLDHTDIVGAMVVPGAMDQPTVLIDLTAEGAEHLGVYSEANIGSVLAIVVDGTIITAPVLQARIETPVLLTGNFTEAEAQALAAQIASDPLPVSLAVRAVTRIGPA